MKIALLGTGKTGSKVMEIHDDVVGFNTGHPPSVEKLKICDVAVSFLPGDALVSYLDILMESRIPVVTGSTGVDWPEEFEERLKEEGLTWIEASNFSLGMIVVREMIEKMASLDDLFDDGSFRIHEIHHKHKTDAPSGTALSWGEWLDREAEITSERKGDEVGYHEIRFDCADETITLSHQAKDRTIFARGAVRAAEMIHGEDLESGLLDFSVLVKEKFKI